MSSCKLKNTIERYATPPRTPYDQLYNKMYNPNSENFHAAPWPMQRTSFDEQLQKEWCTCPHCFSDRSQPEMRQESCDCENCYSNGLQKQQEGCNCESCYSKKSQRQPKMEIIMPFAEGFRHPTKPQLPSYMKSFDRSNRVVQKENYMQQNNRTNGGKKGTFILCYADWCGYCKKYMSMWANFKQQNGNEFDFVEANMSDSKNVIAPENVKPYLKNIQGFPTILCVFASSGKSEKTMHTIQKRDNIIEEIKSKFGNNTVSVL